MSEVHSQLVRAARLQSGKWRRGGQTNTFEEEKGGRTAGTCRRTVGMAWTSDVSVTGSYEIRRNADSATLPSLARPTAYTLHRERREVKRPCEEC